ncbi:hypothetical protein AAC387_Pa11g1172 [Persea americana]
MTMKFFSSSSSSSSSSSLSSMLSLLLVFLLVYISFPAHAQTLSAKKPPVPALIAFGDSTLDSGNNNKLLTLLMCNFPPYGQDFIDRIPTGRFCNGKVPTDFFVASLRIKNLLPASLDPNLKPEDLLTGVNFGSGASGYDPLTAKTASVLSLPDQIKMFKDYIEKLKGIAGEERAAAIISDSIYICDVGIDDILNNYFAIPIRRKQFDISSYTNFIVNLASDFYQELYSLGARKIGIVGLPPGGCFPTQRTIAGGITRECVELYNQAIRMFNSKLSKKVEMLGASLSNSKIIFIEVYDVFDDIIQHPSNYGFEVIDRGCCGTGNIEVAELCNPSTPVCEDVTKYVFWDSFHPTEKTYKILADYVIKNYLPKLL